MSSLCGHWSGKPRLMGGKGPIPPFLGFIEETILLYQEYLGREYGDIVQSGKYLLLSMRTRDPPLERPGEKPQVEVHSCNSSTGEVEMGGSGDRGAHWPANLSYLVIPRPARNNVSKIKQPP